MGECSPEEKNLLWKRQWGECSPGKIIMGESSPKKKEQWGES